VICVQLLITYKISLRNPFIIQVNGICFSILSRRRWIAPLVLICPLNRLLIKRFKLNSRSSLCPFRKIFTSRLFSTHITFFVLFLNAVLRHILQCFIFHNFTFNLFENYFKLFELMTNFTSLDGHKVLNMILLILFLLGAEFDKFDFFLDCGF
jgi:hypothetical protein